MSQTCFRDASLLWVRWLSDILLVIDPDLTGLTIFSCTEWLNDHCAARFYVTPQPSALVDLWGFSEARLPLVTSHIIFTNGLNDGWSVAGITSNLSDTLIAFNMPNGAHHSDLSHTWPSPEDTPDVALVRQLASGVLAGWLEGVPRR